MEHNYQFCPICKTPLIVRPVHGRERQQCPNCAWIHFIDPKVGAGVLIEKEGQVLLARRGVNPRKGFWTFPSGFVEVDETPEETAVREIKEETGLDIVLTSLFDIFPFQSAVKGGGILILYRGQITGGTLTPMDDVDELAFYGLDDLPAADQIAFESNRIALSRWRAEQTG